MVGINAFDDAGKIVPMQAMAARQKAGITDYEDQAKRLERTLKAMGVTKAGRLSIPQWEPDALPQIAAILHGLASDITAIHNEVHDAELRLSKLRYRVRESEDRLRSIGKKR